MDRIKAEIKQTGVDWRGIRLARELAQERRYNAIAKLHRKVRQIHQGRQSK